MRWAECSGESEYHAPYDKGIWQTLRGFRVRCTDQRTGAGGDGTDGNGDTRDDKGVVDETKPEAVIAIDALAARSTKRLNRTIQITDTGINPGSGVGNHRNAINEETLGVSVIAVGTPDGSWEMPQRL